jgi:hypothetical protein
MGAAAPLHDVLGVLHPLPVHHVLNQGAQPVTQQETDVGLRVITTVALVLLVAWAAAPIVAEFVAALR